MLSIQAWTALTEDGPLTFGLEKDPVFTDSSVERCISVYTVYIWTGVLCALWVIFLYTERTRTKREWALLCTRSRRFPLSNFMARTRTRVYTVGMYAFPGNWSTDCLLLYGLGARREFFRPNQGVYTVNGWDPRKVDPDRTGWWPEPSAGDTHTCFRFASSIRSHFL